MLEVITFTNMVGKTIVRIDGLLKGSERAEFMASDGSTFLFRHFQECCESVEIHDVTGDVSDLLGEPLILAEEVTSYEAPYPRGEPGSDFGESFTWTFYRFATRTGHVTVRWLGESDGYYSEDVDLIEQLA